MLSIFYPFFLILPFFSFHFLFSICLFCCDFLPEITITPLFSLCVARVLYIMPTVTGFYHLAFNYPCLVWMYLSTTTDSSMLAVPLPITRQGRLSCLFVYRGTLTYYSVDSLSLYPSWYAPSGSNSSLLLLGGMSSQLDISPKRS